MLKYLTSALLGTKKALDAHRQTLKAHHTIGQGVANLQTLCPSSQAEDPERPIFLLSAGWRSGSTLLQRLILSDSRVMLWGEPYDECGIIQLMAATNLAFRPGWPPADYFYDGSAITELSGEWIANLFPSLEDLRNSHRAFFDTLFIKPAQRAGATRWGIKEVRLNSEHCAYLHWIYPNAKFIFLYRNPLDAYRSYCRYGRNWYDTFPDKPIFTPDSFGKHWRLLMESFLRDAKTLDALMIRYEDLISGSTPLEDIEGYLNISIDRNVLNDKVGSSDRGGEKAHVSRLEKWLLKRAVNPIAHQLGYAW